MSSNLTNARYARMSNTSSPLPMIGQQSQLDDYSQISMTSSQNALLTEDERQKLIFISTLERHFDRCRRRLLGSFFMRLQEQYNKFLRRRIAVAKLNRLIKLHFQRVKEFVFDNIRHKEGKLRRAAELPRKIQARNLPQISDEAANSFDVLASYLKETTPVKPITKREIDKAFAAQKLLNSVHFLFKEAGTKRFAFEILKRPFFLASHRKSFSLDMSLATIRPHSEKGSFEKFLREKSRSKEYINRENLLSGIKKLSDMFLTQREKIFAVLREKTVTPRGKSGPISNRSSQEGAYTSKVSQFFSYRQNRRLRSIDYSHLRHQRQGSDPHGK